MNTASPNRNKIRPAKIKTGSVPMALSNTHLQSPIWFLGQSAERHSNSVCCGHLPWVSLLREAEMAEEGPTGKVEGLPNRALDDFIHLYFSP